MKIEIDFFKPTGRYYTTETAIISNTIECFEVRKYINALVNKSHPTLYAVSKHPNGVPFLIFPKEK